MSHIKFPSIEQYRNAIRNVCHKAQFTGRDESDNPTFDFSKPKPTLKYRGTVKLHGTNAGIVYDYRADTFQYQSRDRIIVVGDDNMGFALAMSAREDTLRKLANAIVDRPDYAHGMEVAGLQETKIVFFGEWCGQGIQSGVAISQVPKMFVIFDVKLYHVETVMGVDDQPYVLEEKAWRLDLKTLPELEAPEQSIYNICNFPTYELDIDFARPELAQAELGRITEEVEACCPVGKHFGVEGVGEGVVWAPVEQGWNKSDHRFKVKGEKHSVSKVRTLAPVDVEAVATLYAFIDNTVTEARLEQGLSVMREQNIPFEMKSLGDFIRWVYNDVVKEEMDTIVASQIDPKKIGSAVANKARPWYITRFNAS